MGRSGNPAKNAWMPLLRLEIGQQWHDHARVHGVEAPDEIWANRQYECLAYYKSEDGRRGMCHLSIKRYDRSAVRDWRHFQQIKNEVCGREREAVEIYPAESRLADNANQYHLWVFPEGLILPFGLDGRAVSTPEDYEKWQREHGDGRMKGRQRPWQPGLTTGQE